MSKLTLKQQAFVDAYMGESRGNATDAARRAGYKGSDGTLQSVGAANVLKPVIAAAIDERRQRVESKRIATIEEMQQLLTEIMRDGGLEPRDRISATKELAKMQGGYAPIKHEVKAEAEVKTKVTLDAKELPTEALKAIMAAKRGS